MSKKKQSIKQLERDLYRVGITALLGILVTAAAKTTGNRVNDKINDHKRRRDEYIDFEEVK